MRGPPGSKEWADDVADLCRLVNASGPVTPLRVARSTRMDGTRVREVAAALIAADLIVEDRSTGQRRYTTKARLALAVTGAIRGEGVEGGK